MGLERNAKHLSPKTAPAIRPESALMETKLSPNAQHSSQTASVRMVPARTETRSFPHAQNPSPKTAFVPMVNALTETKLSNHAQSSSVTAFAKMANAPTETKLSPNAQLHEH